jgi:hypothetical protein
MFFLDMYLTVYNPFFSHKTRARIENIVLAFVLTLYYSIMGKHELEEGLVKYYGHIFVTNDFIGFVTVLLTIMFALIVICRMVKTGLVLILGS